MKWWRRSLRRFVNCGAQPHPSPPDNRPHLSPPLAKGREPELTSPLCNGGLRGVKQWLLLSLLAFTIISGCYGTASQQSTPKISQTSCRTVQHAMGEICIPQKPQRVVALWLDTFRTALALGIKPIASATGTSDEPLPEHLQGEVDGVESVGTLAQPNLEKILLLKPDLILSITRSYLNDVYPQLSNIAPTVVIDVPGIQDYSWQRQLEYLANIFGKEQKEKQLIDEYWQRVEQLKQALGNRRHQLRVSVATLYPGFMGIYAYGKKFPASVVLDDIGLQRPPAQSKDISTISNISQERLSDIDGDVLFLSCRGEEAAKEDLEKLQRSPLWQKLKVVQQNRVYLVDIDHWYASDILAMNAVIDDLFKYLVDTP